MNFESLFQITRNSNIFFTLYVKSSTLFFEIYIFYIAYEIPYLKYSFSKLSKWLPSLARTGFSEYDPWIRNIRFILSETQKPKTPL